MSLKELLYILPEEAPSADPVVDEYSLKMLHLLRNPIKKGAYLGGKISDMRFMGVHQCTGIGCVITSESQDYQITDSHATNTLAVHYLMYHRSEIPTEVFQFLDNIKTDVVDPPTKNETKFWIK